MAGAVSVVVAAGAVVMAGVVAGAGWAVNGDAPDGVYDAATPAATVFPFTLV